MKFQERISGEMKINFKVEFCLSAEVMAMVMLNHHQNLKDWKKASKRAVMSLIQEQLRTHSVGHYVDGAYDSFTMEQIKDLEQIVLEKFNK
jgi:hypothetical protein